MVRRGVRVARIETDDGVQHVRGVYYRPSHGPGGVLKDHERREAGAADEARGHAHADEIVEARRQTD
jgi:hypothetical protein